MNVHFLWKLPVVISFPKVKREGLMTGLVFPHQWFVGVIRGGKQLETYPKYTISAKKHD